LPILRARRISWTSWKPIAISIVMFSSSSIVEGERAGRPSEGLKQRTIQYDQNRINF
jgi:hypothetical protein